MYQARGPRKGQRFTSTQASMESRFAVIKAALRKQSLTYEPYSEEVIHVLWEELQVRYRRGEFCMLRKALQNALLLRLSGPLDDGRMSKNKVNKIFQVLIRSCFVLHSRAMQGDHDGDNLGSEYIGAGGPGNSATASGDKMIGIPFSDNQGKKGPNKTQVMESPGLTRSLRLEMDLTPGKNLAGLKQQEEQEEQREGIKTPRYQHQLQLWEGVEAQAQHKTPPRCQASSWAGFLWAGSSNTKNNNASLREKSYCGPDVRSDTFSDLSLTLTPEESSVFSKTGILPSTGGSSSFTTAADFSEGGSGARGSRSAKGGSGFLYDRDVLRRLNLSPASAKRDVRRRSVSSDDLLAGLRIKMDRDNTDGDVNSPFGCSTSGDEQSGTLVDQDASELGILEQSNKHSWAFSSDNIDEHNVSVQRRDGQSANGQTSNKYRNGQIFHKQSNIGSISNDGKNRNDKIFNEQSVNKPISNGGNKNGQIVHKQSNIGSISNDGETRDGKIFNEQSVNRPINSGENRNGQISNEQSVNESISNGENMNGQIFNKQSVNRPINNGETRNGKIFNEQSVNKPISNGEIRNGQIFHKQSNIGPISNGENKNGKIFNEQSVNKPISNGENRNGQISNEQGSNIQISKEDTKENAIGGAGSGSEGTGVMKAPGLGEKEESESVGAVCELQEDVGSLEEMILIHNTFIRKMASDAGIRVPTREWIAFFGYNQPVSAELEAARRRPAPPLPPPQADPFGYMDKEQLYDFCTAWCKRSHPHEEFCEYAHEEVNHGWLRRNPSKYSYSPRRCPNVILPGPVGEYIDECAKGRSCPLAHSLEEILYHPQAYKTQVCPQGSSCRLREYCPHAHVVSSSSSSGNDDTVSRVFGFRRTKSVGDIERGVSGDEVAAVFSLRLQSSYARARSSERDGSGSTSKMRTVEECQTMERRGRRALSPADREGQTWEPPTRVRSRSWASGESWSHVGDIGGLSREFRKRSVGVTGLLAALRKRGADVMQPAAKHEELLRTIYRTLRQREPDGCDEKELVGRVFHASSCVHKGGECADNICTTSTFPNMPANNDGDRARVTCSLASAPEGGSRTATQSDPSDCRSFSKTKVRGALTLLKFAQAVRVGRGETAGQHVLYVAHELPTFSDFVTRHNQHMVEMARELGVDMTPQDWRVLLEVDYAASRPLSLPSPSCTAICSESSASGYSPSAAAGAVFDAARSSWTAESPTGSHRRPSPCPKPPLHQRLPGVPLPSPPSRQGTPQPTGQGVQLHLQHDQRSQSSSPSPMQGKQLPFLADCNMNGSYMPLRGPSPDQGSGKQILLHDGQLVHVQQQRQHQLRMPPAICLQQEKQHQLDSAQWLVQVGPSQCHPSPTLSEAATPSPTGVRGQTGPGGISRKLQVISPGCINHAPREQQQSQQRQCFQGMKRMTGSSASPPQVVSMCPGQGYYASSSPQQQLASCKPQPQGSLGGCCQVDGGGPNVGYDMMGSDGTSGCGNGVSGKGGIPSGFPRQQDQEFSRHGAVARGSGPDGCWDCGKVYGPESYSPTAFSRGSRGENRGTRWVTVAGHAPRASRFDVDVGVGAAEQRLYGAGFAGREPQVLAPLQHNSLFSRQKTYSAPSLRAAMVSSDGNSGVSTTRVTTGIAASAPTRHELMLKRQSSLPSMLGSPSVSTPARMARTPPASGSRRGVFATNVEESDSIAGDASTASAVAAAVAGGVTTEAWEMERSRLSIGLRGSSPAESRIATVAIATRTMATESESDSAAESVAAAVVESAVGSVFPETIPKGCPETVAVNSVDKGESLRVTSGVSVDAAGRCVEEGPRGNGSGSGVRDQAGLEKNGVSLVRQGVGDQSGAVLPWLSDLTSSGRRCDDDKRGLA